MLKRQIVRHVCWKHRRGLRRFGGFRARGATGLMALTRAATAARRGRSSLRRRRLALRRRRRNGCGSRFCVTSPAGHVAAFFIIPGRFVVDLRRRIKTRVQSVFGQLESFLYDERGIRVVDDVVFRDSIVLNRVIDQPAEKSYVRSRANLQEHIRNCRRSREPRIDDDHLRVANLLRLNRPLEPARMVLGRVAAHYQHHVGVLDVDPTIGHRAAPECWSQT